VRCLCIAPREGQVWSYDFLSGRTSDWQPLRFLTVLDEYTWETADAPLLNGGDVVKGEMG